MSTLKVTNIEHGSTTDGGIQLDSSGHVTIDGQQLPTAGALSSRRININGAMQVAQRATSVTGLSSSNAVQTVDSMFIRINSAGTFTLSQSTESPDGFSNSVKWDCTTADSSPSADDFAYMSYKMEGQDLQHLRKGTSGALQTTVSFWVRSSETGTYAFRIVDSDNSRQVGLNYTIDTADTWEFKTLTLPGDTSGVLGNDNNLSLSLIWWLVVGSNRTSGSLPTAWEATATADEAAGMTANIAASTSSDFYLTGLQFEVGEVATDFEHRGYGDELYRCRRYFQTSFPSNPSTTNTDNNGLVMYGGSATTGTTSFIGVARVEFNPPMRAAPSVTIYDLASPRNTTKLHRHIFGQAGSNNESAVPTNISPNSFNVRSDNGASATGILFQYKAEAEL